MPKVRYKVTLTREEGERLQEMTTRGKHSSQSVLNALILLGCDEGPYQEQHLTAAEMVRVLRVSPRKVDRVKRRFVEQGVEVALDKQPPRRQYVRKADGDFEAHLVALSCSDPPCMKRITR